MEDEKKAVTLNNTTIHYAEGGTVANAAQVFNDDLATCYGPDFEYVVTNMVMVPEIRQLQQQGKIVMQNQQPAYTQVYCIVATVISNKPKQLSMPM